MELPCSGRHLTLIDHIRCMFEDGIGRGDYRWFTRVLNREHIVERLRHGDEYSEVSVGWMGWELENSGEASEVRLGETL